MVPALLVILFICVPILELWLILQVAELLGGGASGAALTIALLIADSLLGAWLVRSQGRTVWRDFSNALNAGKMPAREGVNGGFVILGGTLLLLPGFLSDIVGIAMLVPPTRKVFGGWVLNFVSRRVRVGFTGQTGPADSGMRDFAHSDQPRRPTSTTQGDRTPEFDFETHQLHE